MGGGKNTVEGVAQPHPRREEYAHPSPHTWDAPHAPHSTSQQGPQIHGVRQGRRIIVTPPAAAERSEAEASGALPLLTQGVRQGRRISARQGRDEIGDQYEHRGVYGHIHRFGVHAGRPSGGGPTSPLAYTSLHYVAAGGVKMIRRTPHAYPSPHLSVHPVTP